MQTFRQNKLYVACIVLSVAMIGYVLVENTTLDKRAVSTLAVAAAITFFLTNRFFALLSPLVRMCRVHPVRMTLLVVSIWVAATLFLQYGPAQYLDCNPYQYDCDPTNQSLSDSVLWASVVTPFVVAIPVLLYEYTRQLSQDEQGDKSNDS